MLGDNGFIESPNYPEKYGNNKLCIWRIKVAPEKTLDFTLGTGPKLSRKIVKKLLIKNKHKIWTMKEHLDLEDSNNCQSDGLTLTALRPKTHQIRKFCGQQGTILQQIKTDAHDVIIVFNFGLLK